MAKALYNKSLTTKEKHRVADALYRLRQMGFIIPEAQVKNIKDASDYGTIYEQAVRLEGAVYSPFRFRVTTDTTDPNAFHGSRAGQKKERWFSTREEAEEYMEKNGGELSWKRYEGEAKATIGWEAIKANREWKKAKNKAVNKYGVNPADIPDYNPAAQGPKPWAMKPNETQADLNREFEKRLKYVTRKMKSPLTPEKRAHKLTEQAKKNLCKALSHSVGGMSRPLYLRIRKAIMSMSDDEFNTMYRNMDNRIFDALFLYNSITLGVATNQGTVEAPLDELLKALGIGLYEKTKVKTYEEKGRNKDSAGRFNWRETTIYDLFYSSGGTL